MAQSPQRILAVDDDSDVQRLVRLTLEPEGFEIATAGSGQEALAWIEKNGLPHMAVIDILMPGMDGLALAREIQSRCDLPIVLLTAVDDQKTVIQAIEELAEDYVTKPFHPLELAARVKRVMRRVGDFSFALAPLTVIDERLAIDFFHQEVRVESRAVALTPIETKLLHILIRSARRTVTNDYLLRRIWPNDEVFEDTLRVHVHRLRKKIEPDATQPAYLITQRGIGYSFLPAAG
ncbi:MAG: response regulator transcription factor [Thermoanaerobaculia bacterium]|nr:response regulator transcription factor [Thermoanaerobaculia bacterium]